MIRMMFSALVLWALSMSSQAMGSKDPADWLERMVEARKSETYSGTFVYSRGDEMSSMRVVHRLKNGVEQERLIALDGEPREIVRNGERVICIFPGNEQVELEQALPVGPFSAGIAGDIAPLASVYSISVAGMERLAGHEVVKVALMAKDTFRYSYLLWLEKQSGLLVKSMLTGKEGEILERFQFTELEIGKPVSDDEFTEILQGGVTSHLGQAQAEEKPIPYRWEPGWLPQGFSPAPYVSKTNNVMPEKSRSRIYTDGLTLFTVFVEPVAEAGMPEGASKMGATSAYSRYMDVDSIRYVVTVVGEVPIETAKKVADNMRMKANVESSS
ncbi:MucB/RseB C-terminal domain-containing protein [Hahella ganghwensis]|uniref:MucB/RseB C-terminal domain-containing protein n=1 Tax=Hahella ganghwensis TaxID=286420 RepID=UPI00035D20F5|nr:MucB/RseB C-terminal domain-containing protein [Hahella ganghwensis]